MKIILFGHGDFSKNLSKFIPKIVALLKKYYEHSFKLFIRTLIRDSQIHCLSFFTPLKTSKAKNNANILILL
jgi:hypothetical protein